MKTSGFLAKVTQVPGKKTLVHTNFNCVAKFRMNSLGPLVNFLMKNEGVNIFFGFCHYIAAGTRSTKERGRVLSYFLVALVSIALYPQFGVLLWKRVTKIPKIKQIRIETQMYVPVWNLKTFLF